MCVSKGKPNLLFSLAALSSMMRACHPCPNMRALATLCILKNAEHVGHTNRTTAGLRFLRKDRSSKCRRLPSSTERQPVSCSTCENARRLPRCSQNNKPKLARGGGMQQRHSVKQRYETLGSICFGCNQSAIPISSPVHSHVSVSHILLVLIYATEVREYFWLGEET